MIYEPSYMMPHLTDIDVNNVNTFSCVINADGNSTVSGYSIYIKDTNGNIKFKKENNLISPSLYGGDTLNIDIPKKGTENSCDNGNTYVWNVKLYHNEYDIWVTYGVVNSVDSNTSINIGLSALIQPDMYISINGEKVKINSYNKDTGDCTVDAFTTTPNVDDEYTIYSNYVTSTDVAFKTATTPILHIDTRPTSISNKQYTFTATYTQAENIAYKYYVWTLENASGTVLSTSGKIYHGNIKHTFDGLRNGEKYFVRLTLENQDGVILTDSVNDINITYEAVSIDGVVPSIQTLYNLFANRIYMPKFLSIAGKVGKNTQYSFIKDTPVVGNTSLSLNGSMSWNGGTHTISDDFTAFFCWSSDNPLFTYVYDIFAIYTTPLYMLGMSTSAPSSPEAGDIYFNTVDNLIYNCTVSGVWDLEGEPPVVGGVYTYNNEVYQWDGQGMQPYTKSFQYYGVTCDQVNYQFIYYKTIITYTSLEKGNFQYDMGDKAILSTYLIGKDEYIVSPKDVQARKFKWIDDEVYLDSNIWHAQDINASYIPTHWFKFTLTPRNMLVTTKERT